MRTLCPLPSYPAKFDPHGHVEMQIPLATHLIPITSDSLESNILTISCILSIPWRLLAFLVVLEEKVI